MSKNEWFVSPSYSYSLLLLILLLLTHTLTLTPHLPMTRAEKQQARTGQPCLA